MWARTRAPVAPPHRGGRLLACLAVASLVVASLAVASLVVASPAAATPSHARTGGAGMPGVTGGQEYGQPAARALRVARFAVTPRVLRPERRSARFTYRLVGIASEARVWIELRRADRRRVVARLALGRQRLGRAGEHRWRPSSRLLRPGRYVARLRAVAVPRSRSAATSRSSRLRVLPRPWPRARPAPVRAPAPAPAPSPPAPQPGPAPAPGPAPPLAPAPPSASRGVFPVRGAYSLAGAESRFGAVRNGHVHRGQDIAAAEGVPIVAPVSGAVRWRDFQAGGAGHYVVLRGDDGRDYVFMHLREGSVAVVKDLRVAAGTRIGEVGSTGHSSGPHLHFEIWPGGWLAPGSTPIDPLPELLAWAGAAPRS